MRIFCEANEGRNQRPSEPHRGLATLEFDDIALIRGKTTIICSYFIIERFIRDVVP